MRKSISLKLRFKVLRRDGYKCTYCGKGAVDIELEIDHINPVAKGGKNDFDNLTTACWLCNRGKGTQDVFDIEQIELDADYLNFKYWEMMGEKAILTKQVEAELREMLKKSSYAELKPLIIDIANQHLLNQAEELRN